MSFFPSPMERDTLYVSEAQTQVSPMLVSSGSAGAPYSSRSPGAGGSTSARRLTTRQQEGVHHSRRVSPTRHGGNGGGNRVSFDSTTPLREDLTYPTFTGHDKNRVTLTGSGEVSRSGHGAKGTGQSSSAIPLTLREADLQISPSASSGMQQLGTYPAFVDFASSRQHQQQKVSSAISAHPKTGRSTHSRGFQTISASRQRSPNEGGSRSARSASAGHTNATLSAGVGGGYVIHLGQHPLYTGKGSTKQFRTGPSSGGDRGAGVQGNLAISVEASTVRRLQGGGTTGASIAPAVVTKRALAKGATTSVEGVSVSTPKTEKQAPRGSIIERLAAITQRSTNNSPTIGQSAHDLHANSSTGTSPSVYRQPHSSSDGELKHQLHTAGGDTKTLGPLGLHDLMRMRLQQELFSVRVGAPGGVDRRLSNETLVMPPPQAAPDGKENSMYAELKNFRLPQRAATALQAPTQAPLPAPEAPGGTSAVPLPANSPPVAEVVGAATGPSSSLAPTAAAAIPAPEPSPAPLGTGSVPAATSAEAAVATAASQPQPVSTAQQEVPPVAGATNASTANAPATATVLSSSMPAKSLPQEELRKEKESHSEERLLRDLIAKSHHLYPRCGSWYSCTSDENRAALLPAHHSNLNGSAPGMLLPVVSTNADFAAALEAGVRLRREASGGTLDGWWRPPGHVLLPDPIQPAPTWTVLKSASAQEAQQAAAAAAIAKPTRGSSFISSSSTEAATKAVAPKAANNDDGALQAPFSVDYHAPFQCVQSPECVEDSLVPAALKASAGGGTGVRDLKGNIPAARGTADVSPAAASEGRSEANMDVRATTATAGRAPATRTLGEQAVILHDPFSLLACEHLAEETIHVAARRRAYLSAMHSMDSITRNSASSTSRPGALASMLRDAVPPGEVFCELSYAAKVLLSAILYMRALGALPSLLRVGPLTEYSPVVDKQDCIELVFYNPSEEERREQEAEDERRQLEQQERSRQSMLRERLSGSDVFNNQVPAFSMPLVATLTPTKAKRRGRSLPSKKSPTGSKPGASPPSCSRSHSANDSGSFVGKDITEDNAPPQQRKLSAVEERLMRTLSSTTKRRASFSTLEEFGASAPTERSSLPYRAFRTSLTSLAELQPHSAEASPMTGDTPDESLCPPGTGRSKSLRSGGGGAWLLRSTSHEESAPHISTPQRGGRVTTADRSLSGSDDAYHRSASPTLDCQRSQRAVQRPPLEQRRGSECKGAVVGGVPRVRLTSPSGTLQSGPSHAGSSTTVATGTFPSSLRRSSVTVALEDLQQVIEQFRLEDAMTDATRTLSSPPHSPSVRIKNFADVTKPIRAMPLPPARQESILSPASSTANGADAPASGGVPATAYGPGASRFVKGEQELCVVLRAVIAQKSQVYSFGKAETVHVLPPLPMRNATDGDDDKTLLRKRANDKTAELDRLAVGNTNPLSKFLGGGSRQRKDADGGQWRDALRERARRVATAARQRGPVTVNENGVPTAEDYGDLVVAFLLSGNASELSGSVPDMIELEALRYHIFSLLGYNVSDPAGMQAVKEPAAVGKGFAAAHQRSSANTWLTTTSTSTLEPGSARLHQDLATFTAFQSPASTRSPAREMRSGSRSPRTSRTPVAGVQRRPSFFESALRRIDPLADLAGGAQGRSGASKELQPRMIQALMRRRYPIYRASSVAESTLQAFFTEAKTAVAAARTKRRRLGGAGSPSGGRFSPSDSPLDSWKRRTHAETKKSALQDAERDLLRFRPMNLNSFHRELADALQYALDLQIREGKESVMRAFHM